jgi:hypothetical protein
MGAITRSVANNITTGGIILPAGINDASVASIDALANISAGDGITLISSQTGSGASSIEFTSGIDSTYRTYLFKYINFHVNSDGSNFEFNGSIDGGSNYNVTKTTTYFQASHAESDASASLSYITSRDIAQGTGRQQLGGGDSNDSDHGASGYLYLFSPSSTTYVKHFIACTSSVYFADTAFNNYVAGYFNTTSAINSIGFFPETGTCSGTIHMYGIA